MGSVLASVVIGEGEMVVVALWQLSTVGYVLSTVYVMSMFYNYMEFPLVLWGKQSVLDVLSLDISVLTQQGIKTQKWLPFEENSLTLTESLQQQHSQILDFTAVFLCLIFNQLVA